MNRHRTIERRSSVASVAEAPPSDGATIVAFPTQPRRPSRSAPVSGESRGQILLFLGVRYERLAS